MLKERLRADLNEARRARDKLRTTLLTTTLSEVKNREIEVGRELDDGGVIDVLAKAIKRRREAAGQMTGHRDELAAKEREEADILSGYLPAGMSEEEVRTLVRDAIAGGATAVGAVMGRLMPAIKGRFDGKEANRIAQEELGRPQAG